MNLLHLTASRFFGGPERQMLGLAQALRGKANSFYATFPEEGHGQTFVDEVRQAGFWGTKLTCDSPRLWATRNEVACLVEQHDIDVLLCHGYKAGLIGWLAAQKAEIPVLAVSRGWTAESWKVRRYEQLDRFLLRKMQRVVCVSQGQADKVVACGVKPDRVNVIRNAICVDRFQSPNSDYRRQLLELFPANVRSQIQLVVGAAGRLSPEKGFDVLISAAKQVCQHRSDIGFVLFGDGSLHESLQNQIESLGVGSRFQLAGFTKQLDQFMPHFDLFVQSSHTEGLPNVLLESLAAGVPVVATDVGGTVEVVTDQEHGRIVPPADSGALADAVSQLLDDTKFRVSMGRVGAQWVRQRFGFQQQADQYLSVFQSLAKSSVSPCPTQYQNATSCR